MIALLGATGRIGRTLAHRIAETDNRPLTLFSRAPERISAQSWPSQATVAALDGFDAGRFSLVINALGAGDPARVASLGLDLFDLTRRWDERVLERLREDARYVFLSSGAIYGAGLATAEADAELRLPVNAIERLPPYTAAKLHCEMRHRFTPRRHILDLRVFGYVAPPVDLDGTSFLADLARAIARRTPLTTSPDDMIRDYAGAEEFWALVGAWEGAGAPNRPLDLYTRAPVAKHDLLRAAHAAFGLEVRHADASCFSVPTGAKPVYASGYKAAGELGYVPRRDAMTVVLDALRPLRT